MRPIFTPFILAPLLLWASVIGDFFVANGTEKEFREFSCVTDYRSKTTKSATYQSLLWGHSVYFFVHPTHQANYFSKDTENPAKNASQPFRAEIYVDRTLTRLLARKAEISENFLYDAYAYAQRCPEWCTSIS